MSKDNKALAIVLRVLLALLFLCSSVAKLMAIDDFELYIFSYGLLPLNLCYLVARLCIAAEMALALFISLGWWRRGVNLAAFLLLVFFSLVLCYAALTGRTDNCQCMGQWIRMNPLQSLLKNAVLIAMVLGYARLSSPTSKTSKVRIVLSAVFTVAIIVSVFCISVPDNWMFGPEESRYDRQLLEESIAKDGALGDEGLADGHQLVAFVTRGCPYCRMTREKLGSIARRHHIDTTRIHYYEPHDLPDGHFLRITLGQRPLILLLDGGTPVVTYHYRNINERQVSIFLTE